MPEETVEQEEVKETDTEVSEETETPAESSTEEKPADETVSEDANEELVEAKEDEVLLSQVEGLKAEKTKLLEEIVGLRGQRRSIKEEQIKKVEEKIDELKDVNPEDIAVIEKIMQQRGYLTEAQLNQKLYSQAQQEELDKFLDKYPEFKAENDPGDKKWDALKFALADYAMPVNNIPLADYRQKAQRIFEKARRDIAPSGGLINSEPKKQQARTAAIGGGGSIKSPSVQPRITTEQVEHFRRGGWSEQEIAELQNE